MTAVLPVPEVPSCGRPGCYNHASVEANRAFAAVIAEARPAYEADIELARSLGRDGRISDEAMAAWNDAYDRAKAARERVLARYGLDPRGEPPAEVQCRAA